MSGRVVAVSGASHGTLRTSGSSRTPGYGRWGGPDRVRRTIDAIREHLGEGGALLHRYCETDGLPGDEGFVTPCSSWLAGDLAQCGRADEAAAVIDEVTGLANDVGLYSEETGRDGAFLGNLPQALTHASPISAAVAVGNVEHTQARRSSSYEKCGSTSRA